jgi:hypothetical protein
VREQEGNLVSYYEDDCTAWAKADWQRKSGPGLICHLDTDKHATKITFEINVAEAYEDRSCAHRPDQWKKYEKAQTSCSYWTAVTDKAECERRVQNTVAEVAAQGYVPAFSEPDRDECPYPRF